MKALCLVKHDWQEFDRGGALGKVRQCRRCRLHQTYLLGGWLTTPRPETFLPAERLRDLKKAMGQGEP